MDLLSNTLMRELKKQNDILMNENIKLKTKINLMQKINELLINIRINLQNSLQSIIQLNLNVIEMPDEFESNSRVCTKLGQELDLIVNQLEICDNQSAIDDLINLNNKKRSIDDLQPIDLDNDLINGLFLFLL